MRRAAISGSTIRVVVAAWRRGRSSRRRPSSVAGALATVARRGVVAAGVRPAPWPPARRSSSCVAAALVDAVEHRLPNALVALAARARSWSPLAASWSADLRARRPRRRALVVAVPLLVTHLVVARRDGLRRRQGGRRARCRARAPRRPARRARARARARRRRPRGASPGAPAPSPSARPSSPGPSLALARRPPRSVVDGSMTP